MTTLTISEISLYETEFNILARKYQEFINYENQLARSLDFSEMDVDDLNIILNMVPKQSKIRVRIIEAICDIGLKRY